MMELPLVTVYIPTYNRVELLKRAVESVRKQTYNNIEIIIVDDNSTDGTKAYLTDISKKDPRVSYYIKDTNSGAAISRNIAIKKAKGYFITGLDDDDLFEKDRIMNFLHYWYKAPNNTIALTSLYKTLNNNKSKEPNRILVKKHINFRDLLLNNVVGNQVFTKTETLQSVGGFDESLSCWQDLDLWLRLLKQGNIYKVMLSSYMVDTSHDSPRIGNSKHSKYLASFQSISRKHKLKGKDEKYLYLQTYNCEGVSIAKFDLLKIFFKYPSLNLARSMSTRFIKELIK